MTHSDHGPCMEQPQTLSHYWPGNRLKDHS